MSVENETPQENTVESEVAETRLLSQEEQSELLAELQESQSKASEYLDGWQRARAEFANYKKRVDREQALAQQNASAAVLKRFLEIIDDLDRALKNRPNQGDGAAWAEGIELIARKLSALLEASGITVIEVQGQMFDPNLHEAITHEDLPGYESGQIIEVVKQGYTLGERVLRPATVRVAK